MKTNYDMFEDYWIEVLALAEQNKKELNSGELSFEILIQGATIKFRNDLLSNLKEKGANF